MLEINKIYNEDCLDTMARMPNNFIDLTVTSPPYDKLRNYEGYKFDFKNTAKELYRVTKRGGIIVWIVGDSTIKGSESGTSFKQALHFKDIGFNLHDTMIWKKTGCRYPEINRYYPIFEYMFILSKNKPKTINLIKDRKNKYVGNKIARKKSIRTINGKIIENSANKINPNKKIKKIGIRYNIWKISASSCEGSKIHPATFPENLVNDHIISWSNENDLIYDPFLGSGTTAKMALLSNRNFIGSEISKKYCIISEKRIFDYLLEKEFNEILKNLD